MDKFAKVTIRSFHTFWEHAGSVYHKNDSTIIITGGTVTATGGGAYAAGIGGGSDTPGNVTITGGVVTATSPSGIGIGGGVGCGVGSLTLAWADSSAASGRPVINLQKTNINSLTLQNNNGFARKDIRAVVTKDALNSLSGTVTLLPYDATNAPSLTDAQKPKANNALTYNGANQTLVTNPSSIPSGYTQVVYSLDDWKTQTTAPVAKNAGTYTVKVRYVGDDYHADYDGADISVTIAPKEVTLNWTNTSLTYNGNAQKPTATAGGLATGDVVNVTVTGEKTDVGSNYTATASALSNANYQLPANVTTAFSIGKAASSSGSLTDAQKATDISDLVYNGKNQELVTKPSELPSGYTKVQYSLDAEKTWSDNVPTAKDAGKYVIVVKYVGDANHTDFTDHLFVQIAKKSVKVSGITACDKDYDGITDAALDFRDVKLDGFVEGDNLRVTALGAFSDTNPGADKTVSIRDLRLSGDNPRNYELSSDSQSSATATIFASLVFYSDVNGTTVYKRCRVKPGTSLKDFAGETLPNADNPASADWSFAGWSTKKGVTAYKHKVDGQTEEVIEKEFDFATETMPAEHLNLYPMIVTNWINVKLNPGADDVVMDTTAQSLSFWKQANAGEKVDMTYMNAATRPDYKLLGWYTPTRPFPATCATRTRTAK